MYHEEARQFIKKLIRLQRTIKEMGYVRRDFGAVNQSMAELNKYLDYYKYDTDEKMKAFWNSKQAHISNLLPRPTYKGYEKIMQEYINLNNSKTKQNNEYDFSPTQS